MYDLPCSFSQLFLAICMLTCDLFGVNQLANMFSHTLNFCCKIQALQMMSKDEDVPLKKNHYIALYHCFREKDAMQTCSDALPWSSAPG